MTTLTLEKEESLTKTSFKDSVEMIEYFIEHTNYNYLDFKELDSSEISQDLVDKIQNSKKQNISEFQNI